MFSQQTDLKVQGYMCCVFAIVVSKRELLEIYGPDFRSFAILRVANAIKNPGGFPQFPVLVANKN
jgi:hypothetical protein